MKFSRFCLVVICACLLASAALAQGTVAKIVFTISGEVSKPISMSAEDLSKIPHITVGMAGHDGKSHDFSGIPVQDLLELAGVTTGKQLRGKNLNKFLLVQCADGYQVVFSLAELDADFSDQKAILADATEGKPLAADRGPYRFIMPGEKIPARSCFQVTGFFVGSAKK